MTDKQLKKLTRTQLLELLLEQIQENDRLREENGKLQESLQSRALIMEEAGSVAEAALRLHGIFETAQAAADLYLENVKRMARERQTQAEEGNEQA